MISIVFVIIAIVILLLRQLSIINNPILVFIIVVAIIGGSVFIFKDKLNCPFAKKCPFTFCPLNKQ